MLRFSEVSHIKRAADHSPMQPHITHITKTHRASRRCERSPRIGRPCRWRRHSISLPGRAGNRPIAGDALISSCSFAASLAQASAASNLLFSSVGRSLGHTLGPHWISPRAHSRPHCSQEKMIPINVASSEHFLGASKDSRTFRFGRQIVSLG